MLESPIYPCLGDIMYQKVRTELCENCGGKIPETRANRYAKYCSKKCYDIWAKKHYRGDRPYAKKLPTGTVGTISELVVSIDLMIKGYEVFRALSPHCSCDLAILNGGKLMTIEVKTTQKDTNGKFNQTPIYSHKADIGALVVGNDVLYVPDLPKVDSQLKPC